MVFQRGQPRGRLRGIAARLRTGGWQLACGQLINQIREFLSGEIFIVIFANLNHRRICAGPQTFHLFPAELAIFGNDMGLAGNFFFAHRDQIFCTANHASGGAANLEMRHLANGLKLEHEIEGRNL